MESGAEAAPVSAVRKKSRPRVPRSRPLLSVCYISRRQSRFLTKYSTPDQRVVTTITATHRVLTRSGMGRNMSTMHTMVEAVFTFPDQPAAMTRPWSLATIRSPLTANSGG